MRNALARRDSWIIRVALVLSALLLVPAASSAADASVKKFLDTYCIECHDGETKKGGLDLEKLSADFKEPAAFRVLGQGSRPHPGRRDAAEGPQDTAGQGGGRGGPEGARSGTGRTPIGAARLGDGRAVFRRLNRTEYENTLRDLFGLAGLKVKDLLPEDGRAFGFDKSAAGLDLSYVQLAKYMEAADVALDAAIAPHAARPALFKAHIPGAGVHMPWSRTRSTARPCS